MDCRVHGNRWHSEADTACFRAVLVVKYEAVYCVPFGTIQLFSTVACFIDFVNQLIKTNNQLIDTVLSK